jgi:hypothetical protein
VTRLGEAALVVARREIGCGEAGRNNGGPDVVRYRRGKDDGGAWCASFASYCLEEGSKALGLPCPVKRSAGAKRLVRRALEAGGVSVMPPEVGCLALWHRGAAGASTGHVGIVSRVDGNAFWTICGNKGGYPSKVREYGHEVGEALLLDFVRLPEPVHAPEGI